MNKSYKSIWNASLGGWVAASEIAKGHTKSSSSTLGKAAFALAITVCGSNALALSEVGFNSDVNLYNNDPLTTNTVNTSVINAEQNIASTTGNITITTGENSILAAGGDNSSGIFALIGQSTATGFEGAASDGDITISAQGSITTNGTNLSNGIYAGITNSNATGDIDVTFEGTSIETTGTGGNRGIYVVQQGSGNVNIDSLGESIKTSGTSAHGIYALAGTADLNGGTAPTMGAISVTNTSRIETAGYGSFGILVHSYNEADSVFVQNSGEIVTSAGNSIGIRTLTTSADTTIRLDANSNITTNGSNLSHGVFATSTAGGLIDIYNAGIISSLDSSTIIGHAIYASQETTGDSAGININVENATLSSASSGGTSIRATTSAASGDVNVNVQNSTLNVDGINGDAIYIDNTNSTASNTNLNITVANSTINVLENPSQTGDGFYNFGLAAIQFGPSAGDINIINSNTNITVGLGSTGVTNYGAAIDAIFDNANSTGNISIQNSGTLISKAGVTSGAGLGVIDAKNSGAGNIDILNVGNITSDGNASYGIRGVVGTGNINIINTGSITATGIGSSALHVIATASPADVNGGVSIINSGNLLTENANGSHGIGVDARGSSGTNVSIINNGNIINKTTSSSGIRVNTNGTTSSNISVTNNGYITMPGSRYAIDVDVSNNSIVEVNHNGVIDNSTFGIVAWISGQLAHTGSEATINVGSTGKIINTSYGITTDMSTSNTINIAQGGIVDVNFIGIQFREYSTDGQTNTLNNAGIISSLRDQAIVGQNLAANGTLEINNTGSISGVIKLQDEATSFNNAGTWNLREFRATVNTGPREIKHVAISNFGGGSDLVNNNGTLNLAAVAGDISVINTGEYVPVGALSINNSGTVHGQLLNLGAFNNAGIIDLTENAQAGDVLVITGGTTAGADGGGTYTSNGGTVKLDTLMNTGDVDSLSDILVVDSAQLGSGATRVQVKPAAGSTGGLTVGDGIKVIEVLGTVDEGAFVASNVSYGAYEYYLGKSLTGADNNLYLRNNLNGVVSYSPEAGTYLANQYAAATMFNHNILDRRGSTSVDKSSLDSPLWARLNYSNMKTDVLDGQQREDIDTMVIQLGGDLYRQDNMVAGVYAGYGHSSVDAKSKSSGSKANGKVNGYHIGAYASYLNEDNVGLYADAWGLYGWYKNKVSSLSLDNDSKYDSNSFSVSTEVGYGFKVYEEGSSAWFVEPHAQLIYTHLSADNFIDDNAAVYTSNKAKGLQARLGARMYGEFKQNASTVSPFVEVNWLHNNMDNQIDIENVGLDSKIGENVGELKLGVQSKINDRLSVWGHVGGQAGSENYKRYEAQVGLGYKW